jgi:hypothetical protein
VLASTNSTGYGVTSIYSQEYGSAIVGCVLSAAPSGQNYVGANLPTTLSSNPSSNSLPYTSSAQYGVPQAQTLTFSLSSLNLPPSQYYDFVFVCYNGNGRSPANVLTYQLTSSSLPTPKPQTNGAADKKAALGWTAMVGWALAAAAAMTAMAM